MAALLESLAALLAVRISPIRFKSLPPLSAQVAIATRAVGRRSSMRAFLACLSSLSSASPSPDMPLRVSPPPHPPKVVVAERGVVT